MALVDSNFMQKGQKCRCFLHEPVNSTYYLFATKNGEKVFQIDTYGTKNREYKGKTSQSLQFDKEAALKLIQILTQEFLET